MEGEADQAGGVWLAQTCQSIPSPAGTAAGPWGQRGAHLQKTQQHKANEWMKELLHSGTSAPRAVELALLPPSLFNVSSQGERFEIEGDM